MCHFCERSARGKGPGRDDRIVSSCDNRTDPCAGRASDRSHERGIAPNDVPDRRQTPDGRTTLRASARERPTGARPDTRLRDRSSGSLPIVHGANSVDHVRARYPGSTGFDRLPARTKACASPRTHAGRWQVGRMIPRPAPTSTGPKRHPVRVSAYGGTRSCRMPRRLPLYPPIPPPTGSDRRHAPIKKGGPAGPPRIVRSGFYDQKSLRYCSLPMKPSLVIADRLITASVLSTTS